MKLGFIVNGTSKVASIEESVVFTVKSSYPSDDLDEVVVNEQEFNGILQYSNIVKRASDLGVNEEDSFKETLTNIGNYITSHSEFDDVFEYIVKQVNDDLDEIEFGVDLSEIA